LRVAFTIIYEGLHHLQHNNFAEMMGKMSGSQAAAAVAVERTKLTKLQNSKLYHAQNQIHMANAVKRNNNVITTTEGAINRLEAQRTQLSDLFGGKGITSIKVGKETAATIDEAGIKGLLGTTTNKRIDAEIKALKADPNRMSDKTVHIKTAIEINGVNFDLDIAISKKYNFEEKAPRVSKNITYTSEQLGDFITPLSYPLSVEYLLCLALSQLAPLPLLLCRTIALF